VGIIKELMEIWPNEVYDILLAAKEKAWSRKA